MTHSYQRELTTALEAVRAAARICQSVQSRISPESMEKQDRSPVTIADFASQAAVCRVIGDAFPDDPIIAEEDADSLRVPDNLPFLKQVRAALSEVLGETTSEQTCEWIDRGGTSDYSSRFWTLDPIDGTKGFLRKEQYAVSLALIVDGRIEVGVLACPNLPNLQSPHELPGAMFSAVRGEGAFVQALGDEADMPLPVRVSETIDPAQARFCESVESGHSSQGDSAEIAARLGITAAPARLDSQAKYAVVARGEADIYLRLPTKKGYRERIWDHAGGVILVEEAGGRVSDVEGHPLDFTRGTALEGNRGVIVTNAGLHEGVLAAVQEVLSGKESTAQ